MGLGNKLLAFGIGVALVAGVYYGAKYFSEPETKYVQRSPEAVIEQKKIDNHNFNESGFNLEGDVSYFLFGLEGETYQGFVRQKDYLFYKSQHVGLRGGEDKDVNNYLQEIADKVDEKSKYVTQLRDDVIYKIADPANKAEVAQKILDLVHRKAYIEDAGHDFVKHPIETLIEGGDCDDLGTLYASLAKACDIDTIMVHFENHIAPAVNIKLDEGTYIEFNDKRYYIAEATGTTYPSQPADFKVGHVGKELKDGALVLSILDLKTGKIEDSTEEEKDDILDMIGEKEYGIQRKKPNERIRDTDEETLKENLEKKLSEDEVNEQIDTEFQKAENQKWRDDGYGNVTWDLHNDGKTGQNLEMWMSADEYGDKPNVKEMRLFQNGQLIKVEEGNPQYESSESFWANIKNTKPEKFEYTLEIEYDTGKVRTLEKTVEFTGGVIDNPPIGPKISVSNCNEIVTGVWDHGDNKGITDVFVYKNGEIWKSLKVEEHQREKRSISLYVPMDDTEGPDEYYVQFLDRGGNVSTSRTMLFGEERSYCYDNKPGSEIKRIKNFKDIEFDSPEWLNSKFEQIEKEDNSEILKPGTYKLNEDIFEIEKKESKPFSTKIFNNPDLESNPTYIELVTKMKKEGGEYNIAYTEYINLLKEKKLNKQEVETAEIVFKKEYLEFTESIQTVKQFVLKKALETNNLEPSDVIMNSNKSQKD